MQKTILENHHSDEKDHLELPYLRKNYGCENFQFPQMYTIWVFSVQKRVLITRVQKEISARVYINICTYKHINTYIYKYINKKKPKNSFFLPQNKKKLRIFLDGSRKMRIFAAQNRRE